MLAVLWIPDGRGRRASIKELLVLSEANEEKEICWNLGGQKVFRMQLAEVGEAALWENEVGESALWKRDVIETLWEDIFEEGS